jgi:hypothetical protein
VEKLLSNYNALVNQTKQQAPEALNQIEIIMAGIRDHIKGIPEGVYSKRNELLIAIRLVESFRIFSWIKLCLACTSYQSVFRELRFMLDGVAQACYIDLNHPEASLVSKLEVYKALGDMGGFIGSSLFERIRGFRHKQALKDMYAELSRFVHPSIEESRRWIGSSMTDDIVDSLKSNRFDMELLGQAIEKCQRVGELLISLNDHFVTEFQRLQSEKDHNHRIQTTR